MDLSRPPQWLRDVLPDAARDFLDGPAWWGVLGVLALLVLLLLWLTVGRLVRGLFAGKPQRPPRDDLEEDLESIGPAPPNSGDRKLTVEGIPVRLRLVVVAPAGVGYRIHEGMIAQLLDRVMPGLGDLVERDRPRTRVWPKQLSYEGFANTFHRNTPLPEGEGGASRWVMIAGRADLGDKPVLIGLGLQAVKATTLGRRTLKPHEWQTALRLKVMES